ncbi:hypothetical protein Nepgr_018500 [Nepenthes gracilis]|uniref:Uncharacterized protein n=1 Tax=Nepenthes gracilis TaxID=150966 RepID=A0AAD3STJ3_NEPGR|nr:hypothetical protein Nepgr_018500 [Nepenthes gracilis]
MAMAMRKNNICFLLVVMVVMVPVHMSLVKCRKVGPADRSAMIADSEQAGNVSSAVPANDWSSISSVVRSLGRVLASGPSKKGAGH